MQGKPAPVIKGKTKVSVTTLMASMAVDLVKAMNAECLVVLDAYFAVGPVFLVLKDLTDTAGKQLAHLVTKAKSNAVAYEDPPVKTGGRGAPKKYGKKIKLAHLFKERQNDFQETTLEIYREQKTVFFLCLDLIWKPTKEKVRFVMVTDGGENFILMSSDLRLLPEDIIKAYSYRFKIEVNFKVLKRMIGAFYYHFWTMAWPKIGKLNEVDLSSLKDPRSKRLITEAIGAIEGFVNFGCIATGILQILSLNHHREIWGKYRGWLRTVTSSIPSEETVKSVVQEEFFHNFRIFKHTAIYRIIMSKSKKTQDIQLPMAA